MENATDKNTIDKIITRFKRSKISRICRAVSPYISPLLEVGDELVFRLVERVVYQYGLER